MIFTNDIYRFIGDALLMDGFKDIRDVSIDVIEEKINEFLRMKLCENASMDNVTLLARLESFLDSQNNKDQMMANFIFYLLWYMSTLQGFEITWRIEEVDTPTLLDSEYFPEKIDSLVTNRDIDYIGTFSFVLEEIRKLKNSERGVR